MSVTPLFKKLNLKDEIDEILVLNAPQSFNTELALLPSVSIITDLVGVDQVQFAITFATTKAAVNQAAVELTAKTQGDVLLWFAYPKKSSKKYTSEINRDTGWAALGAAGFEPVRQVAIDQDWSALRFRHIDYIKSFKRKSLSPISEKGKKRAAN